MFQNIKNEVVDVGTSIEVKAIAAAGNALNPRKPFDVDYVS